MKKNSFIALLLAVALPVVCYFIIKNVTAKAVHIPPHYFADSVITTTENGKLKEDTLWHQLTDFELSNQLGEKISWDKMKGKVVVADFFFTHCPSICPQLTLNMRRLQGSITNSKKYGDTHPDFIQFLSFSIDPERDSVLALQQWADKFKVDPRAWWLLTGSKKTIYDLAINDMKIGVQDGSGIDSDFIHTDYFVLIDSNRNVRGFYHGLDSVSLGRLSKDIIFLTLEKNKQNEKAFSKELKLILICSTLFTLISIIGFFIYSKKNAD